MDAEIRRLVFERAAGRCEACGCDITPETGHLDHQRGRVRAVESVENCWALCPPCDVARTRNEPSAIYWWRLIRAHAFENGYLADYEHAQTMVSKQQFKFPKEKK